MNSEHTPLSVSLGDMSVTSDETDTVLSKSDGVTVGDATSVDSFYSHPDNATYARKRFDAIRLTELKLTDTPRDDGLRVAIGTLSQPFTPKEIKLNEDINLVMCEDYVSLNNPDDKHYGVSVFAEGGSRQTGKTRLCRLLFDEQIAQLRDALDSEKSPQEPCLKINMSGISGDVPSTHHLDYNTGRIYPVRGISTDKLDMNELNVSPYLLPELNTDSFKRSTNGEIDFDYELQKAKERTPHWNLRVPKTPLPAGKGLVTSIVELSRFDSTIWTRLDKLGYDVKTLKRCKKTNRMGMKEFLGAYFPRPLLEKLYQLAVNDGCY